MYKNLYQHNALFICHLTNKMTINKFSINMVCKSIRIMIIISHDQYQQEK